MNKDNILLPFSIKMANNVQYYPNPVNDVLTISLTDAIFEAGIQITLYNLTGKLVAEKIISTEENSTMLNLKGVDQGLYLCVIKNNKEIITSFKISVVRQ